MPPIQVTQNADKDLIVRLTDGVSGDPFDLTGVSVINACLVASAPPNVELYYLLKQGTTVIATKIITGIDTTDIQVGQPIFGPGIPANSVVTNTPTSPTPSAPNTIVISQNASASATVALTLGDISIVGDPAIGKILIHLSPAVTALLPPNDPTDPTSLTSFQVTVLLNGFTSIIMFNNALQVLEPLC